MKKLVSVLLAAVLLLSCFGAFAEEISVTPKVQTTINYSYKYAALRIKAGTKVCFMDTYWYDLSAEAEEAEGDVYVALKDLAAMYAPDFTITEDGTQLTLNHFGITVVMDTASADARVNEFNYTFKNAPKVEEGLVMVPMLELLGTCFGTPVGKSGNWYAASYTTDALTLGRSFDMYETMLRGKDYGFVYKTYTIPEDPDQKVLPVRFYIPSTYDPETPMRAIVLLHGNSTSMNYFFHDTCQDTVKYYDSPELFAEKYGYILIAGTAYCVSGNYGDVDNLPYMVADAWEEIDDATKELRIRSEASFNYGLQVALDNYNIDMDHLYLMGNSMGGKGTLFLGNKYAEMWDAIVPCAMMSNLEVIGYNPYPNLVDMPILFCVGTEDAYGYDLALKNWKLLDGYVNDAHFYAAAGGVHNTGWIISLPVIFDFLNAQY